MLRLDGPKLKLERALEHLDQLREEASAFAAENVIPGVAQEDPDGFTVTFNPPAVPLRLSLIAGGVVHNLRTAFEHLVWQLVEANGGTPSRSTGFPVVANSKYAGKPELFIAEHEPRIGLCSDEAQSEIERLQPYNSQPDSESNLLWQVHELDRVDKHQLLNVVSVRFALKPGEDAALYIDGALVENSAAFLLALDPNTTGGAEFGAVGVTEPELKEHLHKMLSIGLVFGPLTPAPGAPIETLQSMHDYCQGLMARFERFLS